MKQALSILFALCIAPALAYADRPSQHSLLFDGGDWVDCGDHADFDLSQEMTFELWAKLGGVPYVDVFLSKDENPGDFVPKYFWGLVPQGGVDYSMAFHVNGPGGNYWGEWAYSDLLPADDGNWHHYALVKQDAEYRFYYDGSLYGMRTMAYTPPAIAHPFLIGRGEDYYFQGYLDEVRVWAQARTPVELRAAMEGLTADRELALVGYWRLNEGSGQTAADASGNEHHGQLGSTAGDDENDPTWADEGTTTAAPLDPARGLLKLTCAPNPFGALTRVHLSAATIGQAEVAVFDPRGRHVRTLFTGQLEPGRGEYTWDGCDDRGLAAPAGVYLIRVAQGSERATVRVTLLR